MQRKKSKHISGPIDDRPIKRVAISMQESEFLRVHAKAKEARMSFSAYVRYMVFGGRVNACLNEEEKELFREMVAMSNDLHQLWKMARDQGVEEAMVHFGTARDLVDKILNIQYHDRQKLSTRKVLPASEQVSVPGSGEVPGPIPGGGEGARLPANGPGFRDDPSIASRQDPSGLPFGTGLPP